MRGSAHKAAYELTEETTLHTPTQTAYDVHHKPAKQSLTDSANHYRSFFQVDLRGSVAEWLGRWTCDQ